MLDNQLIKLFLPIITQGLIDYNISGVAVRQAYQPEQTSTPSSPFISFFKVSDERYGWNKRLDYYDFDDDQYKHIESQIYETTFQVNAYAIQDPADINSLTASDILNTVSEILQSDSTVQQLVSSDVGILRVTDIRNVPWVDDRDQFEYSPSFDFTLRHIQERVTLTNFVTEIDHLIQAV